MSADLWGRIKISTREFISGQQRMDVHVVPPVGMQRRTAASAFSSESRFHRNPARCRVLRRVIKLDPVKTRRARITE